MHDDEVHRAEELARAAGQHHDTAESVSDTATGDAGGAAAADAASHEAAVREARSTPVLRFGGEEVALPFVEHHEEPSAGKPAMSLDLLAEAFSHLGAAPAAEEKTVDTVSGPAAASETSAATTSAASAAATDGQNDRSSRSRGSRGRRNRSASRAQGAANETSVEHHEVTAAAAGGTAHEAKAPAAEEPAKKKAADEPIILGVGVPASEL
ncbi:hypothetical protein StoSoilB13_10730 [Arthrobacter sp. StoSoilB13]|nr:hypothetical protein StoSoilB13_10730 [Arthrobacter sp. StoSoilB13]